MRILSTFVWISLCSALGTVSPAQEPQHYDLLILGGRIVDGTGAPWYRADLAVRGDRIAAIGDLRRARADRVLDAGGLIVAPGFVDMMGQTAAPFLSRPASAFNLLSQGITTINAGEGGSDAPLSEEAAARAGWSTMREYFEKLDAAGIPINMAQTVGHTQLRRIVIGALDRQATAAELERMRAMVREAMEAGAIGLSTSLIYPPAVYASEEEIVELTKVAGEYGGRYFTHMRNEGDRLMEAIEEALRIGRAAGTPVHIFHLKTAGRTNWGKMDLALARIRAARFQGEDVGADIYPYINNGLGIRALIHPRHSAAGPEELLRRLQNPEMRAQIRREMEEEGGWENWFAHVGRDWDRIILAAIRHERYASFSGRSLKSIADATNTDAWDLFFEIAVAGASALPQSMSEANKIKAMREPFVSFDTDAGPATTDPFEGHPRAFGSFPRVIARYVRDLGVISLEESIRKMTSMASNQLMARDRGRLSPGLFADVVIFDYESMRDRATFAEPGLASEGVRWVLVNGKIVLEEGKYTGALPGRVLRGPGFKGR